MTSRRVDGPGRQRASGKSQPRLLRLGVELSWVALGQGLVAVGGLIGVRLLTEVLPPDIYGELALAMTVVTLVQVAVQQPLFESSRRLFHAAATAGETHAFIHALRRLSHRVNLLIVLTGLILIITFVASGQTEWLGLTLAALAVCLVTTWSLSITGILSASRQRAMIAGQEGLQQWLRFAIASALVWWIGPFSGVAMAGYAVAVTLVLASQLWFLRRTLPSSVNPGEAHEDRLERWEPQILRYGWPFAVWGAALTLQMASARWALKFFEAPEAVGLFAVLYHVGHYPVALLVGVLSKFAAPVMFNRAAPGGDAATASEARRLGRLLVASALGVTSLATVAALFGHAALFAALAAPEYRSVSWLLPVQVLASGLFVSSQSASVLSMLSTDSKALLKPRIAAAAIGIALNILATWRYGLPGVVFAGVVYGAISYAWIARIAGLHGGAWFSTPRADRSAG